MSKKESWPNQQATTDRKKMTMEKPRAGRWCKFKKKSPRSSENTQNGLPVYPSLHFFLDLKPPHCLLRMDQRRVALECWAHGRYKEPKANASDVVFDLGFSDPLSLPPSRLPLVSATCFSPPSTCFSPRFTW